MKIQTRIESILEANANVISGFVISWAVWVWIAGPVFGIRTGMGQGFLLTCLFTVSSLLRQYVLRRWFNFRSERQLDERVHGKGCEASGDAGGLPVFPQSAAGNR